MRTLILLLAFSVGAHAAFTTPVFSVTAAGAGVSTISSAAKITFSSTLLIMNESGGGGIDLTLIQPTDFISGSATGNIWHHLTQQTSTGTVTTLIWYAYNSASGALVTSASGAATHTFTAAATPTSTISEIVTGWTGNLMGSDPFDVQTGAMTAAGSSLATGSITPTFDGSLVISAGGMRSAITYTSSPLTSIATINWVTGSIAGSGQAYVVQTTATAVNNTWTMASSGQMAASIASFKPAGAVVPRVFHRVVSQ
jgi:hypothetical protein